MMHSPLLFGVMLHSPIACSFFGYFITVSSIQTAAFSLAALTTTAAVIFAASVRTWFTCFFTVIAPPLSGVPWASTLLFFCRLNRCGLLRWQDQDGPLPSCALPFLRASSGTSGNVGMRWFSTLSFRPTLSSSVVVSPTFSCGNADSVLQRTSL